MSESISVTCPMCGVSMSLKDRSKVGKKASCPNCNNIFVLAESESAVQQSLEENVLATPQGLSPARTSKDISRRDPIARPNGTGGSKAVLMLVGGVTVVLLIGAGLWAAGFFSAGDAVRPNPPVAGGNAKQPPAENKMDLSYLPADAELFIRLKLADAWRTPLIAQLAGQPAVQEALEDIQQTLGLAPADVESLSVGFSELSEQGQQPPGANRVEVAAAAREKFTAVARLKEEVTADSLKLVENGCKELQHDGKTYYLFQPPADPETIETAKPLAVYLAGAKLVVLGSEARVHAAMTAGDNQARRTDLDFIEPDRQLLIVIVPKDKSALLNALPAGGGPDDPAGEMAQVATKSLQAVSVGVNAGTGIELYLQADCTDPEAAQQMKQLLDGLVIEARSGLSSTENPLLSLFAPPATAILSSVKTSVDSATVNTSAILTEQTIDSIKPLAPLAMLALMSGPFGPTEDGPTPIEETPPDTSEAPVVAPIPAEAGRETNK